MTVATNPASTIAEVIRCVRDIIAALPSELALPAEQRVTVTMGKRPTMYEGAPPRVHFRPDKDGSWGDPPTGTGGMGYVAGAAQGCSVYVWGAGNTDDFQHYDSADALVDAVWNALTRAARGRIAGASFGDPATMGDEYFGQTYLYRFVYNRGVQRNAEIWALAANPVGASPPDIGKPPGAVASTIQPLGVTVTPLP